MKRTREHRPGPRFNFLRNLGGPPYPPRVFVSCSRGTYKVLLSTSKSVSCSHVVCVCVRLFVCVCVCQIVAVLFGFLFKPSQKCKTTSNTQQMRRGHTRANPMFAAKAASMMADLSSLITSSNATSEMPVRKTAARIFLPNKQC